MDTNVKHNIKIGVVGCGKMAVAVLNGAVNKKILKKENIFICNKHYENSIKLQEQYGYIAKKSIKETIEGVDIIFLGTKPFVVDNVLNEIKNDYKNQLVISVLAGVKIEKYKSIIPNIKIVRVMPNTPCLINEGMSALCINTDLEKKEQDLVLDIISSCGKAILTTEDKINIITALSGSGPAFYYKIIELFANSAQKLGLNKQEALLLSSQTALGSARMVLENEFDINTLIKNVTTPGGCTEVGNNVLNNSEIDDIIFKTVKDTMQKAIELG